MNVRGMKDKVIDNWNDHKEAYIAAGVVGATCLVIGVTGTAITVRKSPDAMAVQKIIGPTWKPVQTIIQFVERSTPSKHLHKVGTHEYYDSINDAARKTGHSASRISQNVNGLIDNVKGDRFEVVTPM